MDKPQEFIIRITGIRPLMMARGEAANPLDPQARAIKEISQKRKKSDDDHRKLAHLQFVSACYYDENIGIHLPTANMFKALQEGAAKWRQGHLIRIGSMVSGFIATEWKDDLHGSEKCWDHLGAALFDKEGNLYSESPEELYQNKDFVDSRMGRVVSGGKPKMISVTRPIFKKWSAIFKISFLDIAEGRMREILGHSGRTTGIGAWRPEHGLFNVEYL